LRWLHVPGDVAFAIGGLLIAWFVIGLKTGWSHAPARVDEIPAGATAPV
jgi:nitric oxide reductase subunit B